MKNYLPLICGVSGNKLLNEEINFLKKYNPWGIILFARNCSSKIQLKELVREIKDITHEKIPIMIDQEGGRVHRLVYSDEFILYPASLFGKIYESDKIGAIEALDIQCKIIANELIDLGININTSPVLDIPVWDESGVIGDRAFSENKETVSELGKVAINSFLSMGINPVIKHIPGHGRARVDSHFELPIVETSYSELSHIDCDPFKNCNFANLAMTAHVIYKNIDANIPASISKKVINEVIRKYIKFNGLLMTDDISMKALNGDLGQLSVDSIEAGCDLVLHCNGNIREMEEIANTLNKKTLKIGLDNFMTQNAVIKDKFKNHELRSRLQLIIDRHIK